MSDRTPEKIVKQYAKKIVRRLCPGDMSERMVPEDMPERMSEDMSKRMSENMPERLWEDRSERMSDRMPGEMPERMSERMGEDMSERKRCQKLDADGRGWGPAGNTGRGCSLWRRRRRATNIKSNNPHLTGGKKTPFCVMLLFKPLVWE